MGSTDRSLVMGFSAGLPPAMVAPFFTSLRATGYRGQVGLILAHYGDAEIQALSRLADFHLVVDDRYETVPAAVLGPLRRLRHQRGVRRYYPAAFRVAARLSRERRSQTWWEALEYELEGLQALRYGHYRDLLRGPGAGAEEIFISDLRDVLFQRDPFEEPLDGLEVFLEEPTVKVGSEPFNRRWIEALYGRSTLSEMAQDTVSCSGTVIGLREEMLAYLHEMIAAIGWRRRPLGNHDQGVHNYLLRHGRLPGAKVVENGTGRVLTMGAMGRIDEAEDGRIVNRDGSVPAVLHQYDRFGELARRLTATLAPTG